MSLEDFQLKDDTSINTSFMKQEYMKIYHQQGAALGMNSQSIDFIFGENSNYHQLGKIYLELDKTLRKNGNDFKIFYDDGNT